MPGPKNGYKDLIVWQKSMLLVKDIYALVNQLPKKEQYVLCSQILRSAISIPSNIAEGWSRNRKAELVRFFEIAYASSCELETQILICRDRYKSSAYDDILDLTSQTQKMLSRLISNNH